MVIRFQARFAHMESAAKERDLNLEVLSPPEWDELWNAAKQSLEKSGDL
jgi:uncharacterized protein YabN with tetrapyrrole methylase and pyrophosphatase domain